MSYRLGQDGSHWLVLDNSDDSEVFRSLVYAEAQTERDRLNEAESGGGATPSLAAVLAVGASAGGITITNLGAPSATGHAATKGYVDTEAAAAEAAAIAAAAVASEAYTDGEISTLAAAAAAADAVIQGQVTTHAVEIDALQGVQAALTTAIGRALAGDCVLSGGAVTAQGSPDMTVAVAKAAILSGGLLKPVTAGNVTVGAAHATLPRIDLIVASSSGAKACRAGTAAARPVTPALTAGDVILAVVTIPAADTTIGAAQITDARVIRSGVGVDKVTTPAVFNNTAAAQTVYSLVLPAGLLLTGKQLSVIVGGTMLANSGSPTWTFTISFGGVTLFEDTSAAIAADPDRGCWRVSCELSAESANAQRLSGLVSHRTANAAANVAPATGVGDVSTGTNCAIGGTGAIDADAADRTFLITVTMSVANAANETVVEYARAELW